MDNSNKNENKAKKHTEPRNNPESDEESSSNDIKKEYITDNGGKAPAELPSASSDIINEAKKYIKPRNYPESDAENTSNDIQGHPTKATTEEYEDFFQDDNEANNTYKNKPDSSQNRPLSCTMVVNSDIQQRTEEELSQMLEKDLSVSSTSKERYSDDNSSAKDEISSNISDNSTVAISDNAEIEVVSNSSSSDFSPYISKSNNMQQNQNDSSDEKPSSSSTFNDDLNFERVTFSDIDDDNVEEEEYTRKINKGPKQTSSFASHAATFSYDTLPGYINHDKLSTSHGVDLSSSTQQSIILHTPNSSSNNNNNASSSTDASAELPKSASFIIPSSSSHDVVASTSGIVPLKEGVDTDIDNSINEEYEYMQMLQIQQDLIRSRKRKPLSLSDVSPSVVNTRFDYERPSASSNINLSTYRAFFGNLETITEVDTPSTSSDINLSSYRERLLTNVEIVRTTKPFNTYHLGFVTGNNSNINNNQENVEPPTSSASAPSTTSTKITEKEEYSYACSSSTTDLSRIPSSNSGNILRYSLERAPLTPINNNSSASSSSRPSIEGQEENVSSTPSSSKVNNNDASSYEDQSTVNRVLTKRSSTSTVAANINNLDREFGTANNLSNPPPKKLKTKSSSSPSNTRSNDAPSHFQTYFDELQRPKAPVEMTEEEEKELERKKSEIRDHMATQRILHRMNLYADLAERPKSDDEIFVMEDLD